MTESRVEAVARAMCRATDQDPDAYVVPADDWNDAKIWSLFQKSAQAAIEASDAWMKEQGWEPGQKGYSRYKMFAGIHLNPEEVDR